MPDDAALAETSQSHKKEMKEEAGEPASDTADGVVTEVNITGSRLHLIMAAICVCLFIITIEITIVNTSLIAIANDLKSFNRSSWIVTAYLLTYVGLLIIVAKLSDILGRKPVLLFSVAAFALWAGVCGAAQTTTQLIIFRALKGVGAAGVYSSCFIMIFELIPPSKIPKAAAGISVVLAFSLVLGPIFGGAINRSSTWRWIFLFNVPIGIFAFTIFLFLVPRNFPHVNQSSDTIQASFGALAKSILEKIDFLGAFLLLAASVFLVAALENAGLRHPWKSGLVGGFIGLSGILWVTFMLWEWKVTRENGVREPVFPWRFMQRRVSIGLFLTVFLLGPPSTVVIFSIPQRFQVVNNASPLAAGIRLLPYTAVSPISSMVMSTLAAKCKIPGLYLILFASVCQTVGFGLLSKTGLTTDILTSQYGYQALAAWGCGANMTLLTILTPYQVSKRDSAVAQGSIGQLRYMGGAIGVAIATCLLNSYVGSHISEILTPIQINAVLQSSAAVEMLPEALRQPVKQVFATGYNLQMSLLLGFSAAQIPAALLMWQKKQVILGV